MYYYTFKRKEIEKQITWEDVLNNFDNKDLKIREIDKTSTVTKLYAEISEAYKAVVNRSLLYEKLRLFNLKYKDLIESDKSTLYSRFYIPKRSGGMRPIDKPNDRLMEALRELKDLFQEDWHILVHTSAFAYVQGRSAIDSVKKHQKNESKWFLKTDFSNFFGSTTFEFVCSMFSKIYPFCVLNEDANKWNELTTALSLCFLNGGLPQGTPISPMITNIMMVPIDHKIFNELAHRDFVYTRYADDMTISAKSNFNPKLVEDIIVSALNEFQAPFQLKPEKERYGSINGKNWNLGVMLNKNNDITIGYRNKERFKAACSNYLTDQKNGTMWDLASLQSFQGQMSYYNKIEPEAISKIVSKAENKYGLCIKTCLKHDLQPNNHL